MGCSLGQRLLTFVLLLFCTLPWTAAQQVAPSNAPMQSHNYNLQTDEVSSFSAFRIEPLTGNAELGAVRIDNGKGAL